eukprot:scaffold98075_cov54-Phaeocystis_antarctica.AAC.3
MSRRHCSSSDSRASLGRTSRTIWAQSQGSEMVVAAAAPTPRVHRAAAPTEPPPGRGGAPQQPPYMICASPY